MSFVTNMFARWMSRGVNRDLEQMVADIKNGKKLEVKHGPNSGVISLSDDMITYESPAYGSWKVSAKDILVFGEYTTDNGPMIDDWFMVFVTGEDQWVEASNYCAGMDQIREALAVRWNVENLWGSLAFSTNFDSRVLWPSSLAETELFEFTALPQSTWETIERLGVVTLEKSLKPQVLRYMKENSAHET